MNLEIYESVMTINVSTFWMINWNISASKFDFILTQALIWAQRDCTNIKRYQKAQQACKRRAGLFWDARNENKYKKL